VGFIVQLEGLRTSRYSTGTISVLIATSMSDTESGKPGGHTTMGWREIARETRRLVTASVIKRYAAKSR
jgi:hypothetical protein